MISPNSPYPSTKRYGMNSTKANDTYDFEQTSDVTKDGWFEITSKKYGATLWAKVTDEGYIYQIRVPDDATIEIEVVTVDGVYQVIANNSTRELPKKEYAIEGELLSDFVALYPEIFGAATASTKGDIETSSADSDSSADTETPAAEESSTAAVGSDITLDQYYDAVTEAEGNVEEEPEGFIPTEPVAPTSAPVHYFYCEKPDGSSVVYRKNTGAKTYQADLPAFKKNLEKQGIKILNEEIK